jgi:orotidine 5'-phosphate decarboxylase subfamily 2
MADTFGTKLQERIRDQGPLCVGIDPSSGLLEQWERPDSVEGLEFFALAVLEAVTGVVGVIKPQVAFFERFGSAGFRVLERLIKEAHDAELLVIADAKRGDIGSTNDGYAQAWLTDGSPLAVDALTASPFVGFDSLAPLFEAASQSGRGVFVLAATSNPEGRAVQRARTDEGGRVEDMIMRRVSQLNQLEPGLGSLGVVLGATRTTPDFDLSSLSGPFLVPGVGTQGAGVTDVARLFDRCEEGTVLVNVSRDILRAGPERRGLHDATRRWRDDLRSAL